MAARLILFTSLGEFDVSMKGVLGHQTVVLLVAAVAVGGSLSLATFLTRPNQADTLSLWEAAARGLARVTMVNLTVHKPTGDDILPAGIRVDNLAAIDVVISDFPVLMSPAPTQSPLPRPQDTTQDVVLTDGTVPAGGSLVYAYGEFVLAGWLDPGPPLWWCLEEFQFTKAEIAFQVSGQTLPFALRSRLEHPYYNGPADNTQTAIYADLRAEPAVVVSKEPLWTAIDAAAGQRIRIRIDATNLAIWSEDEPPTGEVNVTGGAIEETVPAGWTVEEGSFSVLPDEVITNPDGSQTLTWYEDLPAAMVSHDPNPAYPTGYVTVTRSYTLVSPSLNQAQVELPRAMSNADRTGPADAESAPVVFTVLGVTPPPPPVEIARAEVSLRIAGEKGHDVVLEVEGNGTHLASVRPVRSPGNPDVLEGATGWLTFNLSYPVRLTATYTPDDDPVNGQPNGDTPGWIVVGFPDGKEIAFFHNFNVQDSSTWAWESGDLRPTIRALDETEAAADPALPASAVPEPPSGNWLVAAALRP